MLLRYFYISAYFLAQTKMFLAKTRYI